MVPREHPGSDPGSSPAPSSLVQSSPCQQPSVDASGRTRGSTSCTSDVQPPTTSTSITFVKPQMVSLESSKSHACILYFGFPVCVRAATARMRHVNHLLVLGGASSSTPLACSEGKSLRRCAAAAACRPVGYTQLCDDVGDVHAHRALADEQTSARSAGSRSPRSGSAGRHAPAVSAAPGAESEVAGSLGGSGCRLGRCRPPVLRGTPRHVEPACATRPPGART